MLECLLPTTRADVLTTAQGHREERPRLLRCTHNQSRYAQALFTDQALHSPAEPTHHRLRGEDQEETGVRQQILKPHRLTELIVFG